GSVIVSASVGSEPSELPSSEEPSPSEDAASSGSAAQAARGSRSAASAARRGMRETARAEDAEAAGVESVVRDMRDPFGDAPRAGGVCADGGGRASAPHGGAVRRSSERRPERAGSPDRRRGA